jgi:hypothetical protein
LGGFEVYAAFGDFFHLLVCLGEYIVDLVAVLLFDLF